ncbi:MAG: hypothetical protein LBP98_08155 [Tannerella sp.]|nr:hypothetical protein [Tannerella sp.]
MTAVLRYTPHDGASGSSGANRMTGKTLLPAKTVDVFDRAPGTVHSL